MKLPILIVLLFLTSIAFANNKVYLDIEDGQIVSVFNKSGQNWKTCADDPQCHPIAWPDNTASLVTLSPTQKIKAKDPYTGEMKLEEYVLIEYQYQRMVKGKAYNKAGQGWIDAAYLSKSKKMSFFSEGSPTQNRKKYCPSKGVTKPLTEDLVSVQKAIANKNVKDTAMALSPSVGYCAINPKKSPASYASGNVYDNYVLPQIRKQKVPNVIKENGQAMSTQDLIDVDSLARTIYGEMAGCFKHGLQYPVTVAKVAFNRARTPDREGEFIRGPHSNYKGALAKVVTSASQFSLWRIEISGKPNNSVKMALCPPSNRLKPSWQGYPPSQDEQEIWGNTLRIATEAVLFPKKFMARTKQISELHYTSGLNSFHGMKQAFPWIEDHQVSRNACVQVWKEKRS